jgi:hypothetical protein
VKGCAEQLICRIKNLANQQLIEESRGCVGIARKQWLNCLAGGIAACGGILD